MIGTFMEKIKLVVTETFEFEYGLESIFISTFWNFRFIRTLNWGSENFFNQRLLYTFKYSDGELGGRNEACSYGGTLVRMSR